MIVFKKVVNKADFTSLINITSDVSRFTDSLFYRFPVLKVPGSPFPILQISIARSRNQLNIEQRVGLCKVRMRTVDGQKKKKIIEKKLYEKQ